MYQTSIAHYRNIMTFSGMARDKDGMSNRGSSNVWREFDFDSDVDHKEMTRSYASDDYLARWLPNIKQRNKKPQQTR